MASFPEKPFNVAAARDLFSNREVGLVHPDTKAYVKLGDNGNIELICGNELGIIIDSYTRTVHIYGDSVVFHTKKSNGLRMNRLSFNQKATKYTEPTFVESEVSDMPGLFNGIDEIMGD